MKKEDLEKANDLQEEIKLLDDALNIFSSRKIWNSVRIKFELLDHFPVTLSVDEELEKLLTIYFRKKLSKLEKELEKL